MRVLHIITDLDLGGAETMLYELVSRLDPKQFSSQIISLTDLGIISQKILALGIPVRSLGIKPAAPNPFLIYRLKSWIEEFQPDLIHTWMYHADLIGSVASKLANTNIPLIWGIHHSVPKLTSLKWSTRTVFLINSQISNHIPTKIVCCSQSTFDTHQRWGFNANKMIVIPNGFDLKMYKKDTSARKKIRFELNLPEETTLIALCARFHPDKDHRFFFKVANLLHQIRPDIHFVLCGSNIDRSNSILVNLVERAKVQEVCHLLGKRNDISTILSAADLLISTSHSEAFPLIIGEAMATETLCVVTDAGDSATIVGNAGRAVTSGDEEGFVQACIEMLSLAPKEKQKMGQLARSRIKQFYNISNIIDDYESLYLDNQKDEAYI